MEVLPLPSADSPEAAENERPDLARTRYFLAWFIPMSLYFSFVFVMWIRPAAISNLLVLLFFVCLHITATLGTFWMLYQAVRYERKVLRYALLSGIPFIFVWYSLVRVPLRKEHESESPFIR